MYPIELTEEQKREIEKRKRREERKLKWTLFFSRFKKDGISPNDTRTIQEHCVGDPNRKSFYIAEPLLQDDGSAFISVTESYENGNYYYRGIASGADNAIGFLETNVPIKEIIKRPDGNTLLKQVLRKENMEARRNSYYVSIGEKTELQEGEYSFLRRPAFPMGKITQNADGSFAYDEAATQEVLNRIHIERENEADEESMIGISSAQINEAGIVLAKETCRIDRDIENGTIRYKGINDSALDYSFIPEGQPLKTQDNYYVYIGDVEIGKRAARKTEEDGILKFVSPYRHENIVFWSKGKSLLEYMHNGVDGLNFALGSIFSEMNIANAEKEARVNESAIFAGGILLYENGECQRTKVPPPSVKRIIGPYFMKKEGKMPSYIKLVNNQDGPEDGR